MADNAPYHNIKGKVAWNLGRHEEALKEFDFAIKIDPNNVEYHYNKSKGLEWFGKHEEALNEFYIALRLSLNASFFNNDDAELDEEETPEELSGKDRESLLKEYTILNENLDKILKDNSFDSIVKYHYNKMEELSELSDFSDVLGVSLRDKNILEMRLTTYTSKRILCGFIIERACEIASKSATTLDKGVCKTLLSIALKMYRISSAVEFQQQTYMDTAFMTKFLDQRLNIIKKGTEYKNKPYDDAKSLLAALKGNLKDMYKDYPFYTKLDEELNKSFGFTFPQYSLTMRTFIEFGLDHKFHTISNVPVKDINDEKELMLSIKTIMLDPDKSPLVCISNLRDMIHYSAELTGFNEDVIKNVINFSVLNTMNSLGVINSVEIWRTSTKENRLTIKPFVLLGDGNLLFGVNALIAASKLFSIGISTGKWIYKRELLQEGLRETLKSIENDTADEFEIDVYNKVAPLAKICKRNLFKHKELNEEFLSLIGITFPGEVDVLSIHDSKKLIILWEAKYILERFGSRETNWDLKEFETEYIPKVNAKIEFIRRNIERVLSFYGIQSSADWKVKACFVLPQDSLLRLLLEFKTNDIEFIIAEGVVQFINSI